MGALQTTPVFAQLPRECGTDLTPRAPALQRYNGLSLNLQERAIGIGNSSAQTDPRARSERPQFFAPALMGAFHLTWFFLMIAVRRHIERADELMAEIDVLLSLPDLQLFVHRAPPP
jgi:hypothetical protein